MILNSLDVRNLQKPKRSELNSELGVAGKVSWKKLLAHREPTLDDYNLMKNNDGTVWSLYQILKLPILANTWRIEADPDDTDETQAELVRENFELPPYKGGMSTPFHLVISRMLKATLEGRSSFEKVWTLNDKGQIVYKKIAPREATTVEILTDDNGGFAGFKQKTYNGTKWVDVDIPVDKCFLFTVNKEENELEGLSMFRAAWYHYDRKHRLYYLYEQSIQSGAIPPKALNVLEDNEADDDTHAANLAALDDFSTGIAASALIPKGYDLNVPDSGKGRMDAMPGVEHHNSEMARSILAQFILLGNQGETGSYALSKSHSDIFIMAELGLMKTIEDHINSYLIPQLISFNFASPKYPTFKFNDMTDDTRELTESVFLKIIEKIPEGMREDFMSGLYKQMASRLGIELDEDGEVVGKTENNSSRTNNSRGQKKKKNLTSLNPNRPLTEAEESVDLAGLERKLNTLEEQFLEDIEPVYRKITDQALEDLKPVLESGDLLRLEDFSLTSQPEYKNIIKDSMNSTYVYSKQKASDEIEQKIPKTPSDSKDYIDQVAESIADKQFSDLTFKIKAAVTAEVHKGELSRKNLSAEDVVALLSDEFESFYEDIIGITGSVIVSEALNRARDDVFRAYQDRIAVYQYSAILDVRTCPLCEGLDNTIASDRDYVRTRFVPPLHFYCRCIWIAILKDQTDIPEETGIPDFDDDVLKYQNLSSTRIETILATITNSSKAHTH